MFQQESLDHIMLGGSFIETRIWQKYQLNEIRTLHTSGGPLFTLHVPIKSDLPQLKSLEDEHLVHQS